MKICLIRHGETNWNLEKRIQGQFDVPLNANGTRQAVSMAGMASAQAFSAIYSSDLARAIETARFLAKGRHTDVRIMPSLRERHFGIFQGLKAEEGRAMHPEAYGKYIARNVEYDFETGESLDAFDKRVVEAMLHLRRVHEKETIAVVTHAGVLDIVYRRATGRLLSAQRDFSIPNCVLNWFSIGEQGWHVERWGHEYPAAEGGFVE
jgi:probable phosphoglycerate mutase